MTIVLDSETEQIVSTKLATGRYQSADQLIRESLRLLDERDDNEQQRIAWREQITVGLTQLDEGRTVVLDENTLADIKARGRARLAQQTRTEAA